MADHIVVVYDDDDRPLAELAFAEGTPPEEIDLECARYKQSRLEARAKKEARRTEPRTDVTRCSACGEEILVTEVAEHIYKTCPYAERFRSMGLKPT